MAEEGFDDRNETSDPDKDYGLPKVDIKPFRIAESKPEQGTERLVTNVPTSVSPSSFESPAKPQDSKYVSEGEKKGRSYGWLVLVLLLISIIAGGYYYYYFSGEGELVQTKEPATREEPMAPDSMTRDPLPAEEAVEEVETFALTEIQSRIDRPRYFLVVASFIDEDLAKDHAEKLHAKEMSTFLVYPYGEIAYYRLAIGRFENFADAAEEISRVKDRFKENLWVLKY